MSEKPDLTPDLTTTDQEHAETPKAEMLPENVVEGFEEGDTILIEAETKDGEEFGKNYHSLEDVRNFLAGNPDYEICKPETIKIELVKKIAD